MRGGGRPSGRVRYRGQLDSAADRGLILSTISRFLRLPVDLTSLFHPAVAAWFEHSFAAPTAAQARAWPAIQAGRHVLIAAPTGSGKTLAAFLAAIDGLVRQGLAGRLEDETQIVYVSPLKALSNDIQKNLEAPARRHPRGLARARPAGGRRSARWVRTGDTPPGERDSDAPAAAAHPRHDAGIALHPARLGIRPRRCSRRTRTVIVDEIHALAPNKRGVASRAVAGAARGAVRPAAAAHRPVGDAEADRGGRALPGRRADDGDRARSSTPATAARATSRSRCRRRRSKRSCRARSGSRSTTASPS